MSQGIGRLENTSLIQIFSVASDWTSLVPNEKREMKNYWMKSSNFLSSNEQIEQSKVFTIKSEQTRDGNQFDYSSQLHCQLVTFASVQNVCKLKISGELNMAAFSTFFLFWVMFEGENEAKREVKVDTGGVWWKCIVCEGRKRPGDNLEGEREDWVSFAYHAAALASVGVPGKPVEGVEGRVPTGRAV